MSRLGTRLSDLGKAKRKALVTFVTAGDPTPAWSVPALRALVAGGADILELGVPFSDPEAEGPAIQASSARALVHGISLLDVLEMVREFRTQDETTPLVLMGYLNAVEQMGYGAFAERAREAGVDGVILVNLPPEEAPPLRAELLEAGMDLVLLVAPTTTDARARIIAESATGFVYYVSLKGVTGADHLQVDSIAGNVAKLQRYTTLPVLVGFGIKDAAAAHAVSRCADGVVIGSVLVSTMGRLRDTPEQIPGALKRQAAELRAAIDAP